MKISRFFQHKCIRNQIWPCRKKRSRSNQIHHLCKPGRAHIPNAIYKVPRPLAFWFQRRRYFKGFYLIWAWPPSWWCDHYHLVQIYSTQFKESPYEIWVQLAKWFLRKLCFDILMGLQYEWPWLKGQRSTLTFGIASEHIKWEQWLWLQQYLKKSTFQKKSKFKCIRKQIWPSCSVGQGQPMIIIWTNLEGPTSQMLHTKSQVHVPSGSGGEDS